MKTFTMIVYFTNEGMPFTFSVVTRNLDLEEVVDTNLRPYIGAETIVTLTFNPGFSMTFNLVYIKDIVVTEFLYKGIESSSKN